MCRSVALVALAGLLASGAAAVARADVVAYDAATGRPRAVAAPARAVIHVPPACRAFAATHGSMQQLSLAACLQDASRAAVTERDALAPMVDAMFAALEAPTRIDLGLLEHGSTPIQIRAAWQVASAHLALITRARAAIGPPGADPVAVARAWELHGALEPLLVRAWRTVAMACTAIVHAADDRPDLAADPVLAYEIAQARAQLRLLPRAD